MQLTELASNSYDQIPYDSTAFAQSHPDRLATLATLFGLPAAQVSNCRVLELGCASGGNLIPMAAELPDAQFVGIDLSRRQIDDGLATIKSLGLKNISLVHRDLSSIDKSFGEFDYIVAHGIYSWVSDSAQEQILTICRDNLGVNGVAYVSYNTYPGWHFRGMIRDMMLYHAGNLTDPRQKAAQARAILNFLAQSATDGSAYSIMLKNEAEMLMRQSDSYLLHDHLEEQNQPLYFHQFVERATRHGLQFLAEAEFSTMITANLPATIAETLARISSEIVKTEQYMDFVRNRTFRQTLLCHQEAQLRRNLEWSHLTSLEIASPAKPASPDTNLQSLESGAFLLPNGLTLNVTRPITKAALRCLGEQWPRSMSFNALLQAARGRQASLMIQDAQSDLIEREALGADLLFAYSQNAISLRTIAAGFVTDISERPKASNIARHLARTQLPLINRLHEQVNADVFSRHLIELLDGTRDRELLLAKLKRLVESGVLIVQKDGQKLVEGNGLDEALRTAMDESLKSMARSALLVA